MAARKIKVIMRKLDNKGIPFDPEVTQKFDARVADNLMKIKNVKWELVEDPRGDVKKEKPQNDK